MRNLLKSICFVSFFLFVGNILSAQSKQSVYLGLGCGLDYGGVFGGKVEYLPVKNFGLFGGLGYHVLSAGWNVGATYKITPDKKISPNLMLFYGSNGVAKVEGASYYDMTSYGVSFGANLDVFTGKKSKLSIGLFVPIRSKEFNDNYDDMKADSRIEIKNDLLPIAISIGYNFRL
jgi:hypothetical protein